jgi:branched-chain amino acid transport system permease protein
MRQLLHLLFFAALVFIPGYLLSNYMAEYEQSVIALCGINVILAVSLNLVNGFTGQFSLGHAGFMGVGAYTSAALTTLWLPTLQIPFFTSGIGQIIFFLFAILTGGAAAGFAGFLVGVPSLRLKGDYLAIVTLGFGEIIRIFILNIESIGGARGLISIPQFTNHYWIIGVAVVACVWLHRIIQSIPGKQFMAVRDDETATSAMGLSTTRIKVRSFVFASFFAGVAGALFAHYISYLNPSIFNFNYSFQIVAMVVLGGMGSLSGSVMAAILLTMLLEVLRPLQELTGGIDFRMVIYAVVLIVLMLTRPEGMFGRREIWNLFSRSRKKAGA